MPGPLGVRLPHRTRQAAEQIAMARGIPLSAFLREAVVAAVEQAAPTTDGAR
jgi:hypothetical protein